MTTETLRAAAKLMRERAEAARAGRWFADGSQVRSDWRFGAHNVAECQGSLAEGNRINAEHIASWHPAVAVAVADWLDNFAEHWDTSDPDEWDVALAVARAYLGGGR